MQCPGATTVTETTNLNHGASAGVVQYTLWATCPDYYYKVHVIRSDLYNSNNAITFAGY